MAAKNEPFSQRRRCETSSGTCTLSLILARVLGSDPIADAGLKTHSIWHIRDTISRLDIVQRPLAAPLTNQLPAENTIFGQVHVGVATPSVLPPSRRE